MSRLVDVGYVFGALAYAPALLYQTLVHKKHRGAWSERFGDVPRRASDRPCVWIHAVSVGEVNATRRVTAQLREAVPDADVVISTTTDTGYARARTLYPELTVFRYPLDFSFVVRRAMNRIRPTLIVLMELEVWYNLLAIAERTGVPVAVVNGRLTERSARRFGWIGPVARRMFARLAWVGAQSEDFAERFRRVGVATDRVEITGSLKWDTADIVDSVEGTDALATAMGIDRQRPLIVAGSTGPGEEAIVLDAYARVRQSHPRARLAIVPRKPERFDAVAELIEQRGYRCARRSRMPNDNGASSADDRETVFLGDTMGELRKFYSLARVVFVGRTLIPLGGSDMMEVAALARPVIVGPHTSNFPQATRALVEGEGMLVVSDAESLADTISKLLADAGACRRVGEAARRVVRANQGSTDRTVRRLTDLLTRAVAARTGS